MAKRVLFVSKAESSASTRYRALQFFPLLRAAGYTAEHATVAGSPHAYLRALWLAKKADIVIVLRKTFPAPLLWVLRRVSKTLMFDFDDAIFRNSNGSYSKTRMHRFSAMATTCDHLFAGNHFLAEAAEKHNTSVTVIPTAIDMRHYQTLSEKPADFIDLVWIGSKSTRKYLIEILPALHQAASIIPQLRLKVIADFSLPNAKLPTLEIPWSAMTEARELRSAHIGIAPLIDNDWSRGKCGLKVLQYMAAALPVISSNVGANAEIILDGQTGFLVEDDASWVSRIIMLANDAPLRNRLGAEGWRRARENYAVEPVFSRIATVLNEFS